MDEVSRFGCGGDCSLLTSSRGGGGTKEDCNLKCQNLQILQLNVEKKKTLISTVGKFVKLRVEVEG